MPELELSQSNIENHPDRATAYVAAVMLAPNDQALRDELLRTREIRRELKKCRLRSDFGNVGYSTPATDVHEREKLEKKELQKRVQRRLLHGMIAGHILYELLVANEQGTVRTIKEVRQELTNRDTDFGKLIARNRISESSIRANIWPGYRPVAHLYSAHRRRDFLWEGPFPCHESALAQFLALAEADRKAGEALPLKNQGKRTALIPDETWRVPSSIILPDPPH